MGSTTPAASTSAPDRTPIYLEPPSKYTNSDQNANRAADRPSLEWLCRTWTVTHSTLSMWRSARNVRITYTPLPASSMSSTSSTSSTPSTDASAATTQIDDLVEYEPTSSTTKLKTVHGVDKQSGPTAWDWRGKGWLFFVTSHWEILGSGELRAPETGEVLERWVVTWFAPTVFTKEGIDFYSDRREGMSEGLYGTLIEKLRGVHDVEGLAFEEPPEWRRMVHEDMRAVEVKLPWIGK